MFELDSEVGPNEILGYISKVPGCCGKSWEITQKYHENSKKKRKFKTSALVKGYRPKIGEAVNFITDDDNSIRLVKKTLPHEGKAPCGQCGQYVVPHIHAIKETKIQTCPLCVHEMSIKKKEVSVIDGVLNLIMVISIMAIILSMVSMFLDLCETLPAIP